MSATDPARPQATVHQYLANASPESYDYPPVIYGLIAHGKRAEA